MKKILSTTTLTCSLVLFVSILLTPSEGVALQNSDPLEVLMVTEGCCHDYDTQKVLLESEISDRVGNINFTIDDSEEPMIARFNNTEWATEFDLVLYNNCQAGVDDVEWIEQIVDAHAEYQVPAVLLHCSMHNYRGDTMKWFEFAGVRSHRHESHHPFTVENIANDHPVVANFPDSWRTPQGELYTISEVMPNATPLLRAYGDDTEAYQTVAWTHEYEGVRVFGTTLGHHNETMQHEAFLNLVSAGLLWAAGELDDDGTPTPQFEGDVDLGWISLFDGDSLAGWRASENTESFSVEDGMIIVDGPRSHLFYEGPVAGGLFKNFEFKAEVYTHAEANSGIFFHTRFQEVGWPQRGYEAQVNATHGDQRKTGSLYAVNDVMNTAPHEDEEWFDYHITVVDNEITIAIDGEVVMEYTEPVDREGTISLSQGTFALQAHDPNSVVFYRNLMVRPLPD